LWGFDFHLFEVQLSPLGVHSHAYHPAVQPHILLIRMWMKNMWDDL
jgi:hypothetical protein